MMRAAALALALLPCAAAAGERVTGTNDYVHNTETFRYGDGQYWRQDNAGRFESSQGPLGAGDARCIGAGFGDASGVRGEGICIFETSAQDGFVWAWQARPGEPNAWQVIGGTGRFAGMTGEGISRSRVASEFLPQQRRVTDWEGEVAFRK